MTIDECWPIERAEQLKNLWEAKIHSAAEIAEVMGLRRNQVLGKAHRMGLSKRSTAGVTKPRKRPAKKGVDCRVISIETRAAMKSRPIEESILQPFQESLNLTLEQKNHNDCSWPMGDGPPFLFCGLPVIIGTSYCRHHNRAAHKSPESTRNVRPNTFRI